MKSLNSILLIEGHEHYFELSGYYVHNKLEVERHQQLKHYLLVDNSRLPNLVQWHESPIITSIEKIIFIPREISIEGEMIASPFSSYSISGTT